MSRMRIIYPEQEPGRERTAPMYEDQERGRGRDREMARSGGYDTYEGRGYDRRRMAYDEGRRDYGGRMAYGDESRMIGFGVRNRGYSMHGDGHKGGEYEMGHGISMMGSLSERDAEEWVYSMKSADGSKSPKFKYEDVEAMLKKKGWKCDPLDVWVGMNALYSDLCEVNAKFGITGEHKDYWLEAACAYWIDDEDAVEDKLTAYYNHVVK